MMNRAIIPLFSLHPQSVRNEQKGNEDLTAVAATALLTLVSSNIEVIQEWHKDF